MTLVVHKTRPKYEKFQLCLEPDTVVCKCYVVKRPWSKFFEIMGDDEMLAFVTDELVYDFDDLKVPESHRCNGYAQTLIHAILSARGSIFDADVPITICAKFSGHRSSFLVSTLHIASISVIFNNKNGIWSIRASQRGNRESS